MPNFLKVFRKSEKKTPNKKNKNVTTPGSVNTTATAMETPDRKRNADDDDSDDNSSSNSSNSSSGSSGSSSGTELPWDVEDSGDEHSIDGPKGRRKHHKNDTVHVDVDVDVDGPHDDEDAQTSRSMLSLGKRSLRPLSPPSEAGLPKSEGNNDNAKDNGDNNGNLSPEDPEGEEEMPMDEKEQDKKHLALCGLGEVEESMSADYLCDYTINALNGICGISPTNKPSPEADKPSPSSTEKQSPPSPKETTPVPTETHSQPVSKTAAARALMATRFKPPYGVEEQTAIEVEYIEPARRDRERDDSKSDASAASVGANPKTKQLLVQAMARRAKQEYETQKGRPAHLASSTLTATNANANANEAKVLSDAIESRDTASPPPPPDNVYSTFTSSEKRKFLKLINTGLSPIDATVQLLKDRQEPAAEPEVEPEPVPESESDYQDTKSPPKASVPNLPIPEPVPEQQRSMPQLEIQPQLLSHEVPLPEQENDNAKEEEPFAKSGINYYDAVRKETAEEWIPEELSPPTQDKPAKQRRRPRPRLSKFAFFRPGSKGKQLVEEEPPLPPKQTLETIAPPRSQQDPPQAVPITKPKQLPESMPEEQPRFSNPAIPTTTPNNPTPSTENELLQEMDEVAETSRSIFKPIQVTPPPIGLPPSLSQDSLLDAMEEQPHEDDYYFDDNEEDDDDEQQQQLLYSVQQPNKQPEQEQEIVVGQVGAVVEEPSANGIETEQQRVQLQLHEGELLEPDEDYDDEDDDDDDYDENNDMVPLAPEPQLQNQQEQKEEEIVVPRNTQDHFITESYDDAIEEDLAAKLLGVPMASQLARSPGRPTATDEALDLDLDTSYLNSTEVMSHYNQVASVMGDQTVRTTGTYGTAGTNYTTSTRSRRPGASKQRLTAQKTGESLGNAKKFKGWQESIQAAAAGIGRVWDPVKGWVDFKEMEDEKKLDDSVAISFVPQPHTPKIARQTAEVQEQAPQDSVDSPDSLEVQGEAMVLEEQAYSHNKQQIRASTSPSRAAAVSTKDVASPPKSRGWMQTMKEATARLETEGKKWDPQRGWVGVDDEDSTPYMDRYRGDVDEPGLADTQDFGTIHQPTPTQTQLRELGHPKTESFPVSREPRDPTGQQPSNFVRKDPNGHVLHVDDDHHSDIQSVDASTKSGTAGRYIQIGDTGSVSSYYFGKTAAVPARTPNRELKTPLASTPENMESQKDEDASTSTVPASGRTSLLVNVKKEKVSPADASMFPELPKPTKGTRRGPGPIDLDEIDDEENGSFGAPQDFSWDDDNFDSPGGTPKQSRTRTSPGKTIQSQSPSEVSYGSVSTKSVPRLRAPTRDTSPIRGRGANEQPTQPRQPAPPRQKPVDPSPSGQTPPPVPRPSRPQQKRFVPDVDSSLKPTPNQRLANVPQDRPETKNANIPQDRPETMIPKIAQNKPETNFSNIPKGHAEAKIANIPRDRPEPTISSDSNPERFPKLSEASSDVGNDARSTYTTESSPSVNSVKRLHDYWERRSTGDLMVPQNAEWKTFLSQKVLAESNAAEAQKRRGNYDDKDSLFDFQESEGAFPRTRKNPSLGASPRQDDPGLRSLQEISNLSPIRNVHDDDDEDDDDETPSEVSTSVAQGTTFLQRLQACAAPMMPKSTMEGGVNCNPLPVAHLAFMRNNPAANAGSPDQSKSTSRLFPSGLWNKPDIIVEEVDDEQVVEEKGAAAHQKSYHDQPRSTTPSGRQLGDMSSVISDEQFGQKTAYLEALAMKAAVSGSKKNRRTRSSGSSDTGSSKHTESWQRFLDKKKGNSEDSSDVQGAAERYASEKVEEMIGSMAARDRSSDFQPRPMEDATGAFPSVGNHNRFKNGDQFQWKNESTKAAEDLAAARVEAMMHALSSPRTLDEGEVEI